MIIKENISLKPYNTFGIDAKARYFIEITSVDQLRQSLQLEDYPPILVLSGGSNMLLTGDLERLVLYLNIKGKRILWEDDDRVALKIMTGENWHELVLWCLERNYGGIENLSLIPGNTGTAPIQNIGAYGIEIKDVFESCEAMEVDSQGLVRFDKQDCQFGYRDSFFKKEGKGKFIITSVVLLLRKRDHILKTSYGAIEEQLRSQKITKPTIKEISEAVIAIRRRKLPDPGELGNSGSFFKNPVLDQQHFNEFIEKHPDAPHYSLEDGTVKVPAGWLIEQTGYKGKRVGDAGVHKDQALVLVNFGNASGSEIRQLAQSIQNDVSLKFGIDLVAEVNIID
ncbi:MAG: UDP-N-acetylmuramate dehydrogenase [Flavobacteriaceae bacterium]